MQKAEMRFAHLGFFVVGFRVPRFKVQGSRFKVQGSGFRVQVAASPPFLEDGILVSQPSPLGNAIKLRKSLAT
ncbi:MAG: hypothetical protein EGQ71_04015 [Dialister sp.]|nr:hypothetical protein [Dialister sp.]